MYRSNIIMYTHPYYLDQAGSDAGSGGAHVICNNHHMQPSLVHTMHIKINPQCTHVVLTGLYRK